MEKKEHLQFQKIQLIISYLKLKNQQQIIIN